jgi:predicted metal-dependent HD superfamily phosphohydrolase
MSESLPELWTKLCRRFSDNQLLIDNLWQELRANYETDNRHYHNLNHINFLIEQLLGCRSEIKNWDAVVFAAFYHDIIYNTGRGDNEEQSAAFAVTRLEELGVDKMTISACAGHILATGNHGASENSDTTIFIDADLSILGAPWDQYLEYSKNIRQEYVQVPDAMYKLGRRGVLMKFLNRETIFHNKYFAEKYEEQAKENMRQELQLLS